MQLSSFWELLKTWFICLVLMELFKIDMWEHSKVFEKSQCFTTPKPSSVWKCSNSSHTLTQTAENFSSPTYQQNKKHNK